MCTQVCCLCVQFVSGMPKIIHTCGIACVRDMHCFFVQSVIVISKFLSVYTLCMQVYCLDVQFVSEMPKFIAGCMTALSAMVQLELPHVNVLTKMDLCKNKVCAPGMGVALNEAAAPPPIGETCIFEGCKCCVRACMRCAAHARASLPPSLCERTRPTHHATHANAHARTIHRWHHQALCLCIHQTF